MARRASMRVNARCGGWMLVGLVLAACVGCGDDAEAGSGGVAGEGDGEPAGAGDEAGAGAAADALDTSGCDAIELEPPELGVQLQMPVFVGANDETEYCMLYQVEEGFELSWADGRYTAGSHHGLVQKTSYTEIPTETISGEAFDGDPTLPHPCRNAGDLWDVKGVIAGGRDVASALAQEREGRLSELQVLPDDVAYTIEAGDVLLVDFHMINYDSEDVNACYKTNLHGVDPAQVEHEAGVLFFYNPFITIPAGSRGTAHHACPITEDIELVTAVSHMHERGVAYESRLWDGDPSAEGSSEVRALHSSTEWEDPERDVFDPALSISAGHWIEWRCDYENTEDRNVSQGLKSTDEMCMFIGTYYPRDEAMERCHGGLDGTPLVEGDMNGEEFMSCLFGGDIVVVGAGDDPERYRTQECFTHTCPKVAPTLTPFLSCLRDNKALEPCGAERDAVMAATCD